MTSIPRRLMLAAILATLALVPALSAIAAPNANQSVQTATFGWFTHANGQGGAGNLGFTVANDAVANWWDAWRNLGRENAVGYPASRRFVFDGFTVQINQKLVFQKNDAFGGLAFLNVFDIMSERGDDAWLEAVRSVPPPFNNDDERGMTWEQIRAKRLAFLDVNPAIRAAYLSAADPVSQYGLPVSFKDYGNVFVLRAQRAVFQQWKEDVPWASRGQVVIANGGDIFKERGYAGDAATPEPAPSGAPVVAAPTPAPAPPAPVPGGVRFPGVGYGFQVNAANDLPRALQMTRDAGFNWVKIQLRWEDLEPVQGQVNWGLIDQYVNQTNAAGVRLLFSVVTAPGWSRRDDDRTVPGPPRDMQLFANFLGSLAARHKGKIHAIEVWNEANLWYEWGGRGRMNAGEYVDMLRRSYIAIKAADPDVVVVSGAPTPTGAPLPDAIDDLLWIQQIYAAGAKNYFDALGLHPSGYNNPPDDWIDRNSTGSTQFKGHGSFYLRRFEQIREVMVANGDQNKQIWFTEFGWASIGNPHPEYAYAREVSEQQQAQWLVRAFELGRNAGYVGPMFVWNLNFATGEPENDRYAKRAFAVLYPDWSPRPAYNALRDMPKSIR